MTHSQQELSIVAKPVSDRLRPKIIKWKGVPMVRNHSFLATVQEIVDFNSVIDVCRIGIIGDMHSGKSTLADAIACGVHHKAKVPYTVKTFKKEELLNFRETLRQLKPANYVLIFRDVSFLGANADKKAIEMVKQAFTEIRHMDGGRDVKIIMIQEYHYTLGQDKYLREADFRYFTTVGSSEKENMEKIFGTKYNILLQQFKNLRQMGVTKNVFKMRVGPKEVFSYKYRNPFIPVLFFNEQSPRLIVTPIRQFMTPICSVCANAEGRLKSEISIEQYATEAETKFNKTTFVTAIKQKLREQGIDCYSNVFVQARRYLDRSLEKKLISLEELAAHYQLKPTRTKMRKKLDGILAS